MLTPEQLEERRDWVGASDIAAIMGECNYRSVRDVWMEKVYGLEPEKKPKEFDAKMWGHILEPAALKAFEEVKGLPVQTTDLVRFVDGTRIRCTLDGWVEEGGMIVPVEAKSSGAKNPFLVDMDEWGETGTDHFPVKYIIQLHAQMMATPSTFGYETAILATPKGLLHRLYQCERIDDVCDAILKAVDWFWDLVERRVEPDGVPPRIETLKRLRRIPESIVRIPREGIEPIIRWKEATSAIKEMQDAADDAKAESISLLGATEAGWLQLHHDDAVALAAALGLPVETAGEYAKLTYSADKNGRRTLRLSKADTAFMEAAADAPLIDLKQLNLIGGER